MLLYHSNTFQSCFRAHIRLKLEINSVQSCQDLVYKIVPNLEKDEFDRERKFYADRGLPCPKDQIAEESEEAAKEDKMTPDANTNMDFHRFDELVCIHEVMFILFEPDFIKFESDLHLISMQNCQDLKPESK